MYLELGHFQGEAFGKTRLTANGLDGPQTFRSITKGHRNGNQSQPQRECNPNVGILLPSRGLPLDAIPNIGFEFSVFSVVRSPSLLVLFRKRRLSAARKGTIFKICSEQLGLGRRKHDEACKGNPSRPGQVNNNLRGQVLCNTITIPLPLLGTKSSVVPSIHRKASNRQKDCDNQGGSTRRTW